MRYIKKRDPMAKYYQMREVDDEIECCPMCGEPVRMSDGIARSPIDHELYHIDCILTEYWRMKGYEEE